MVGVDEVTARLVGCLQNHARVIVRQNVDVSEKVNNGRIDKSSQSYESPINVKRAQLLRAMLSNTPYSVNQAQEETLLCI